MDMTPEAWKALFFFCYISTVIGLFILAVRFSDGPGN